MALKIPYCTVAEADTILADNAAWLALGAGTKQDALTTARYYMDAQFQCNVSSTETPEELKYANAWLAADDALNGGLYESSNTRAVIKRKKVKAGPVETEKEYFSNTDFVPDSYDKVRNLLVGYCVAVSPNTVHLVRA